LRLALAAFAAALALLAATASPGSSAWRTPAGLLTAPDAPLMRSIVPLVFLLALLPGVIYGVASGSVKSHKDVVAGMSKAMSGMGYYIVLAFFAAQFIQAFGTSNLGALIALEGARALQAAGLPNQVTLAGIIVLAGLVNLFIGSASAKWALLAPLFVPMLMQVGISPDLTQAAYRVGDSTTNILTPLMPYFPLIVVYCQRYAKSSGIGTVVATMLPYSVVLFIGWTVLLLVLWAAGVPLGVGASYGYAAPGGGS
jgi:aminobenzoyl-glutamate transport protein